MTELTVTQPIVFVRDGATFANSRDVSAFFEKQHKHVLERYDRLDCSENFNRSNFRPVAYTDEKGEARRSIDMTRDGFVFIAFSFTGKRAAKFKEDYIAEFNRMEAELRDRAKPALSVNQQLRIVAEARKTLGVKAAAKMWGDVGLPMPAAETRHAPTTSDDDTALAYAAIARTGSASYREVYRRCKTIRAHRLKLALGRLEEEGRIVCQKQSRGQGWPIVTYHLVQSKAIIAAKNQASEIDEMVMKTARASGGAPKTALYRAAKNRGWTNEALMERIDRLVGDGSLKVSYFHHGPAGGRPLTIYIAPRN